jgi:hypothetical protein
MQPIEPFLVFTRRFNDLGLRYMVTGSTAAIFYGEPRMTNDVDVVLFLGREEAVRLAAGFPPEEFYCPPITVIEIEASRPQRGHFNLIHHETGFRADLYLVAGDPLHAWAMDRVRIVDLEGDSVRFAPPEYVIVRKLQYFREGGSEKHLRDIARMLVCLEPEWNRHDLNQLIARYGLGAEWGRIDQG